MTDDVVFGFKADTADAILRMLKPVESPTNHQTHDTRPHALLAVATTGVPGRTGGALGNADVAVKFVDWSGANLVIQDAAHTVKAHNLAADAVATGAYIILHQVNTFWIVIWEEC